MFIRSYTVGVGGGTCVLHLIVPVTGDTIHSIQGLSHTYPNTSAFQYFYQAQLILLTIRIRSPVILAIDVVDERCIAGPGTR